MNEMKRRFEEGHRGHSQHGPVGFGKEVGLNPSVTGNGKAISSLCVSIPCVENGLGWRNMTYKTFLLALAAFWGFSRENVS